MNELANGTMLFHGKYRIDGLLGQGGFGITYRATNVDLNMTVAIKEFFIPQYCGRQYNGLNLVLGTSSTLSLVEDYRKRFRREAQIIASLKHDNIVKVLDIFDENNTSYYVMEYIDGSSLAGCGRLPEKEAVRIVGEVAKALKYIHGKRINHFDVKPDNIMRRRDGSIVLIDFGVSRHFDPTSNHTSQVAGFSDGFSPIEQVANSIKGNFSPESDVYSLGATLFCLLTGKVPPSASDVLNYGLPMDELRGVSSKVKDCIVKSMEPRRNVRVNNVEMFLVSGGVVVPSDSKTKLNFTFRGFAWCFFATYLLGNLRLALIDLVCSSDSFLAFVYYFAVLLPTFILVLGVFNLFKRERRVFGCYYLLVWLFLSQTIFPTIEGSSQGLSILHGISFVLLLISFIRNNFVDLVSTGVCRYFSTFTIRFSPQLLLFIGWSIVSGVDTYYLDLFFIDQIKISELIVVASIGVYCLVLPMGKCRVRSGLVLVSIAFLSFLLYCISRFDLKSSTLFHRVDLSYLCQYAIFIVGFLLSFLGAFLYYRKNPVSGIVDEASNSEYSNNKTLVKLK